VCTREHSQCAVSSSAEGASRALAGRLDATPALHPPGCASLRGGRCGGPLGGHPLGAALRLGVREVAAAAAPGPPAPLANPSSRPLADSRACTAACTAACAAACAASDSALASAESAASAAARRSGATRPPTCGRRGDQLRRRGRGGQRRALSCSEPRTLGSVGELAAAQLQRRASAAEEEYSEEPALPLPAAVVSDPSPQPTPRPTTPRPSRHRHWRIRRHPARRLSPLALPTSPNSRYLLQLASLSDNILSQPSRCSFSLVKTTC
jgi:hypothetical protein